MKKISFYSSLFLLCVVAFGIALYKFHYLGFPLIPREQDKVWVIEAKVSFYASDGPVKVSLFIPEIPKHLSLLNDGYSASDYGYMEEKAQTNGRYAIWSTRHDIGLQDLYYRMKVYHSLESVKNLIATDKPTELEQLPFFNEPYNSAIQSIIEQAREKSTDATTMTAQILSLISLNTDAGKMLLTNSGLTESRAELVCSILQLARVPVRFVKGFVADKSRRNVPLVTMIEVYDQGQWIPFNVDTGTIGFPQMFAIWQRGLEPVLIVEGGAGSSLSVSIIEEYVSAEGLARRRIKNSFREVFDFSLDTLPVESRNVFRGLFLVPIGALIVVVMRVVIGFPTSGTFMPILIAMAFRETQLLNGLVLFVVIVGIGLIIRSYLSNMNLLLVPRISAVVIVVVFLMAFLSIFSYRLGLEQGLSITFFPMIILAWTIERMSIIWEEQGARNALIQIGGCLCISVVIYLVITNELIAYLAFTFPELLLIVLAVIMALGTYSGYRLSELFRFNSMVEEQ